MNKPILLSLIILSGICTNLYAQSGLWNKPEAYLGQSLPADTPKIFAPGLLADKGSFSIERVAISSDGKEIYYCTNTTWFDNTNGKIRYFKYDGKKWNGPFVLNEQYSAPAFSSDDKTLYFTGRKNGVVWESHRTDTGWSAPAEYIKRNYELYEFMPTASGNKYAGSNGTWGKPGDFDSWRFCKMPASNADTSIQSLGLPLNSPGFNGDFFIAQDESYMIISTKETKDFECKLYISYRKADKSWTNPKTLGPLINEGVAHRFGQYVSPDNKYLFYTRGTSEKDCAIYWGRFDRLLKHLKQTNFEPYVKKPIADQSASAGQHFSLQIPDDTFFDDDGNNTLAYNATLGDGKGLPDWLKFDPVKKIISGTAPGSGTYSITIMANDPLKAVASCTFSLTVRKS